MTLPLSCRSIRSSLPRGLPFSRSLILVRTSSLNLLSLVAGQPVVGMRRIMRYARKLSNYEPIPISRLSSFPYRVRVRCTIVDRQSYRRYQDLIVARLVVETDRLIWRSPLCDFYALAPICTARSSIRPANGMVSV